MKSESDKSKVFKAKIKKIVLAFGLHAFSLILFFVLVDILIGGFIFYNYVFLAENATPQTAGSILKFNNAAYQELLGQLQTREQSNVQVLAPGK